MDKIKTTNFNKSLDKHYGQYGHTYKTLLEAKQALKDRGFKKVGGVWKRYNKQAFVYRLYDRKYISPYCDRYKVVDKGWLVTFDSANIPHFDCRLQEVVKPRVDKQREMELLTC